MPCRLDDICATAGDRCVCGGTDNQSLSADGGETVNVSTDVQLNDIVFCEEL